MGTGVWKVEIVRNWFGSISVFFFVNTSVSFLQVSSKKNFFLHNDEQFMQKMTMEGVHENPSVMLMDSLKAKQGALDIVG